MTALLEYLLARKISKGAVVNVGISEDRVNALYADSEPTIDEIRKISKVLKVAARDLIVPLKRDLGHRAKLRSNFNYTYDDLSFFEACLIENRFFEITESVDFLSDLPYFLDYQKDSNSAEELSRIFRCHLLDVDLYSPLIQLPTTLYDRFSIILFIFSSRRVDGASFRRDNSAIIAIAERNDIRMLYTLAHEICHLLVDISDHHNREAWIDDDVLSNPLTDVRTAEFFANEFAAALLIPLEGLLDEIKRVSSRLEGPGQLTAYHIAWIARRFGTSFSVAARRCENLRLLDAGGAVALENLIKKSFQSAEKYADEMQIAPRQSVDWRYPARQTIERLGPKFESGDVSLMRMYELLNLKIV